MKLDDRYEVRIYIASIYDPEMMYDDFRYYEIDHPNTPFNVWYYIYDNEIKMSAVECDTGDGFYETVEEAIEDYEYRIKMKVRY